MSETTKESEKPPETPQVEPPPGQWVKPAGYDPVDLDALGLTPEQKAAIQPRFNHLFAQAKAGTEVKRENRELREHLDKLTLAVDSLQTKDAEKTKAQIEDEIVKARDEGRVRDELKLQQTLTEISAPKPEPKPEPKQTNEDYVRAAEAWAIETNVDGTLKRPWIREDHPDNTVALGILHKVRGEWQQRGIEITPQTMPLLLNEMDQRMARPQPKPQQTVLSTSQIRPQTKPDEVSLNEEQKHTARRLYSHLPGDKAEAAYAKAYGALRASGQAR